MFCRRTCRANQAVPPEIADASLSRFECAYKRDVLLMFFSFSYSRDARYVFESTITSKRRFPCTIPIRAMRFWRER